MSSPQVVQIVIAQVIANNYCPDPNTLQYAAIISLILSSGLIAGIVGINIVALATTVITLVLSGASIEALTAAIVNLMGPFVVSSQIVVQLYHDIKDILGC